MLAFRHSLQLTKSRFLNSSSYKSNMLLEAKCEVSMIEVN
jgi:hypothetical protein